MPQKQIRIQQTTAQRGQNSGEVIIKSESLTATSTLNLSKYALSFNILTSEATSSAANELFKAPAEALSKSYRPGKTELT